MELYDLLVIVGAVQILLMLIAGVVIVWNKKFSTVGRVIRFLEIVFLPVLGPILILIDVLLQRDEKDKRNT